MKELRRFVWYLAGRLFVILMAVCLCILVFFYAMNASNIYVVLKDGMARRAQVIMMDESPNLLTRYFQTSWLQRDQNLQQALDGESPYKCYNVRGIDHRLKMTWMWCWPWENTARATFIETVPRIDGRLNSAYAGTARELFGDSYQSPPRWQGIKYNAVLVKENSQWRVRSLTAVQSVENE